MIQSHEIPEVLSHDFATVFITIAEVPYACQEIKLEQRREVRKPTKEHSSSFIVLVVTTCF